MKPYIAILIDSFWEAIGNRVLWALLIGWTLILAALAPFGYIIERSFQLSSVDIDNRGELISSLAKGVRGDGSRGLQAIARRLDPDFASKVVQAANKDDGQASSSVSSSQLVEQLNKVLQLSDLYSAEDFPSADRRTRLQPLIEASVDASIDPLQVEELNRELLQLAFPLELNRPQGEQLWVGYAGFKLGDPLPVSRRQIKQFFEPILLASIIKLGLGILAVFVAIVVTSPIIPETFRSGSLHLLLSKPISRVWLYLAKFCGGCIFVLVNITYVLIGLYLIAGWRFEIWNAGLLACIPILMFVFVIFYSVSGLAGLVWGNAIVCVVTCLIFWLFCFATGFMHDALLPQAEVLPQLSRVRLIEKHLLVVNERGDLNAWNEEFSIWQPALDLDVRGPARTFGPIYDPQRRLIIAKSFFRVPFGGLNARSRKISIIRLDQQSASGQTTSDEKQASEADLDKSTSEQPTTVSEARETPLWISDSGPELPAQLFDVVEVGATVLAICRGGLYRLDMDKLDVSETSQKGLFGLKLPWSNLSAFENIAPKDYVLSANSRATPTQAGDGLVVYSSGSLDYLSLSDNRLQLVHSGKLEGDGTEAALVEMNDDFCVVARDKLPLKILNSQFEALHELSLPDQQQVRQLSWIPDTSDLAILTHSGNCYRLDCSQGTLSQYLGSSLQGQITCLDWESAERVWLGIKPNSAVLCAPHEDQIVTQHVPRATMLERIFRWGVKPLYTVNPKPAALDNAMAYVLTGNTTQSMSLITNDLEAAQIEVDVWTPIVSNLIFVAFVLAFSCWYVSRKEY